MLKVPMRPIARVCGSAVILLAEFCAGQRLQLGTRPVPLGMFTAVQDIATAKPGISEFRLAESNYWISGGGTAMGGRADALRFAWVRRSGSFSFSSGLHLDAPVANSQAGGMLLIRQGLEPDAAFAGILYEADGRVLSLVRPRADAPTQITVLGDGNVHHLQLTRIGDQITASFIGDNLHVHPRFTVTLPLVDPVYVGIGVSAHTPFALQSATFSDLRLSPLP